MTMPMHRQRSISIFVFCYQKVGTTLLNRYSVMSARQMIGLSRLFWDGRELDAATDVALRHDLNDGVQAFSYFFEVKVFFNKMHNF